MTDDLRAITVRQPWAWAIAHGGKTIENRSQPTRYRGPVLIHAGAGWSDRGERDPRVRDLLVTRAGTPATRSAVIAVAQLVDCHPDAGCCRPWGESEYTEAGGRTRTAIHHLVLEDVAPLAQPVPARGQLGLWRPSPEVAAAAVPVRTCRVCGCTDDNACLTGGRPCSWVAPDLCSACVCHHTVAEGCTGHGDF